MSTSPLITIATVLRDTIDRLQFAPPVTHVYNPLIYAWSLHRDYLERFGEGPGRVVLVGMNPGPFGMAQTGVPFGDVAIVRDWIKLDGEVGTPPDAHPKRPVEGLAFGRSEVSGSRLWGWARERFATPEAFFDRFFVMNYCPLAFLESSGRNRTPDKLPVSERTPLFAICDQALRDSVSALSPSRVIGIGRFAEARAARALAGLEIPIGTILHPSPASPAANRGWAEQAELQLAEQGIELSNATS